MMTPTAVLFANDPNAKRVLWGMSLFEKILRQLANVGYQRAFLVCENNHHAKLVRDDFHRWHHIDIIQYSPEQGDINILKQAAKEAAGHILVLDASAGYDERIFHHVLHKLENNTDYQLATPQAHTPTLLALTPTSIASLPSHATYQTLPLSLQSLQTEDMDVYIKKMRRQMVPYAIAINSDSSIEQLEKTCFNSIYKGATDLITKFVFPTPVRHFTRWISHSNITPNQLTYLSMVLSFGAIPLFFMGHFWPAICMGFAMAFLDTADGKLARTTLRTSTSGDLLDHVSDTVYLWFWYFGTGWYFSQGNIFDFESFPTQMTWLLVGTFSIDKVLTGLFKRIYGQELHDYARLDYIARTLIARRNPFLACMLLSLIMAKPIVGFYAIALWNACTFIFHSIRFVYLPLSGQKHQSIQI
ncbi:MAG: CDP-alcohol phosphatidyltransferase family protein [Bdellovibrionota bacterium]